MFYSLINLVLVFIINPTGVLRLDWTEESKLLYNYPGPTHPQHSFGASTLTPVACSAEPIPFVTAEQRDFGDFGVSRSAQPLWRGVTQGRDFGERSFFYLELES